MAGLTVSMYLVYPSWIPQYILFEILTEARAGWTDQPARMARSLSSELRTSAHLFWGGFRHGKYWQNLQTQGLPPVWGGGVLSCGLPASSAMSGRTVSMHLVYPNRIPQYILFEILTEARAGWTGEPTGIARSLPSELLTSAQISLSGVSVMVSTSRIYRHRVNCQGAGGFCHVGYQQALQCQGLQSVCIWFTLAEFHSTCCLKY